MCEVRACGVPTRGEELEAHPGRGWVMAATIPQPPRFVITTACGLCWTTPELEAHGL